MFNIPGLDQFNNINYVFDVIRLNSMKQIALTS